MYVTLLIVKIEAFKEFSFRQKQAALRSTAKGEGPRIPCIIHLTLSDVGGRLTIPPKRELENFLVFNSDFDQYRRGGLHYIFS